MRRQEYSKILKEWNDFLLKEENLLLNEQLLLENFLLSEGLSDIANKYGKKGLLYLVSLVLSSALSSKDASAEALNLNDNQRDTIERSLKNPPEGAGELEDLVEEHKDEVVAKIKSKTKSYNQASFKGFLTPEDLERFHSETGKKVFSQENMSIASLPGIYVKETFELNKASGKELTKILEKAKKIYDEELDERTFLITVNGKKYAVVVESDLENSRNQIIRILNRWSINIANTLTDLIVSKINSNDKKLIERAQECRLRLSSRLADESFSAFNNINKTYLASYISAKHYESYFWRCAGSEVGESSTFNYDNSNLMGIITLSSGFFESRRKNLEAVLIHELGHLLSDQSGTEIVAAHLLKKFYKFLNRKNKVNSFNLKDIGEFILMEELRDHDMNASGMLPLLSKKSKKIVLKASKAFANQLLGGGAIEAVDDQNFSFIIGLGQAYYTNLEERVENIFTVINSIYTYRGYEPNAIKVLNRIKKKNPSMKKEDLQNLFNEKYIEFVLSKRKIYFESLINDILKSSFFDLDFENMNSSILNTRKAKRIIRAFINKKTRGKKHFENFDDLRLMKLMNFEGFGRNPVVGKKWLIKSIVNMRRLAKENNESHEGHEGHDN